MSKGIIGGSGVPVSHCIAESGPRASSKSIRSQAGRMVDASPPLALGAWPVRHMGPVNRASVAWAKPCACATSKCGCRARLRRRNSRLEAIAPGERPCAGIANPCTSIPTTGVSVFALQLARVLGARVIATTSTAEKAERLKALGASDVINHRLARRAEPTDRLKLPEFTDSPAEGDGFELSVPPARGVA